MSRPTGNMRKAGNEYAKKKMIEHLTDANGKIIPDIYQVPSRSKPNEVYTIDMKDKQSHAKDCEGFKYHQNCSHIQGINRFLRYEKHSEESKKK